MNMHSNLPPGVSEDMIPGNRPEDAEWDKFHEFIDEQAAVFGLDAEAAKDVWLVGLDSLKPDYQSEPIRAAINLLIEEKNLFKQIANRQEKVIENLERMLALRNGGMVVSGN